LNNRRESLVFLDGVFVDNLEDSEHAVLTAREQVLIVE
jgi:hypothetical protein